MKHIPENRLKSSVILCDCFNRFMFVISKQKTNNMLPVIKIKKKIGFFTVSSPLQLNVMFLLLRMIVMI